MPVQSTDLVLVERAGVPYRSTAGAIAGLGGAGGSIAQGVTIVDFGPMPGSPHAQVNVIGQAAISSASILQCWILPEQTDDHSVDEHVVDPPRVVAGNIIDGVGFTVYASLREPPAVSSRMDRGRWITEKPVLPYGKWTVAWRWI